MTVIKKPSESSTIVAAVVGLIVVVVEALLSHYVLAEPILDNGTRITIVTGALVMIGFRFKTSTGVRLAWLIIPTILLFTIAGCAYTMSSVTEMHADRMENRVDKMYVVEAGRDDRGLMIRVPRPSNPTESLIEATLGWTRNYAGFAALPLDENDTGRYMRGSNMGINAKDALNGKMDDILLIEIHTGKASEAEEEVVEETTEVAEGVVDE